MAAHRINLSELNIMLNNKGKKAMLEDAVKMVLHAIGEDITREGLLETPARVARMYEEIYEGLNYTNSEICDLLIKSFTEPDSTDSDRFGDMVIVKDIPLFSSCEHHLITFFGKAHVGYIPSEQVIGISKIARLVDMISKRPQIQERITKDVAECLEKMLTPLGAIVVIEAEHLCMSARGVRKAGAITVTSAARGVFKTDSATRAEFMSLIK